MSRDSFIEGLALGGLVTKAQICLRRGELEKTREILEQVIYLLKKHEPKSDS